MQRTPQLLCSGGVHHHSSVEWLMESKIHAINEIRQVVNKVLLDRSIGSVHTQQILVTSLGSFQACIVKFLFAFLVLFFNQAIFSRFFSLFHGNSFLQFFTLFFYHLKELGKGLLTVFENHRKSLIQHFATFTCWVDKSSSNAKNRQFWRVFENLKFAVKQYY